eukprot:1243781-Amorphochlora_amoeboformis.AAC.1
MAVNILSNSADMMTSPLIARWISWSVDRTLSSRRLKRSISWNNTVDKESRTPFFRIKMSGWADMRWSVAGTLSSMSIAAKLTISLLVRAPSTPVPTFGCMDSWRFRAFQRSRGLPGRAAL